ncbi:hypothetical protein L1787_13300 [Acuticoccus sp. M5D2P5]|uniref:hypothetical protein n=1 Tax=Acuticoccus kalidii TaxID=2910977 RepID=UPI001F46EC0D|nr:hypothetical protein [Acuticoccus kalidii]MCF3934382.1 hypothetical protein [Acuticoccus kalidii]
MNVPSKIVLALGLTLAFCGSSYAATMAECDAGIEEVNAKITSAQGVGESARDDARRLSDEASNARDAGEYDRCMELVQQADEALAK